MSKRIIAIGAAAALALAFGCEGQRGERTSEQSQRGGAQVVGHNEGAQGTQGKQGTQGTQGTQGSMAQREHTTRSQDESQGRHTFDQAPQPREQQPGGTQGEMGQHQMGQMGQAGAAQARPGEIVTMESQANFAQTVSRLTRDMRQNHLDVISQVRYDRAMRERAMRHMGQQTGQTGARAQAGQTGQAGMHGQAGMQGQAGQHGQMHAGTTGQAMQGERIGDVRLILFRRSDVEARTIETQGPQALLNQPRELLVFERGGKTTVAYRTPEEAAMPGMEEPTGEILNRVVRDATQGTTTRQPTAQRTQTQHQQTARAGQTGQHPQGQQAQTGRQPTASAGQTGQPSQQGQMGAQGQTGQPSSQQGQMGAQARAEQQRAQTQY